MFLLKSKYAETAMPVVENLEILTIIYSMEQITHQPA